MLIFLVFVCKVEEVLIEPSSISNEAVQLIPIVGPYHPPTHLLHLTSPQSPNKKPQWRQYGVIIVTEITNILLILEELNEANLQSKF